jgi:hypothetical protein
MNADDVAMHLEISQVLARYCHAVDHGDLELALGAYWPDAVDHHGGHWDGNAHDYMRDLLGRFAATRSEAQPTGCMHHLSTTLITRLGADDARVQTYFTALVPYEADGGPRLGLLAGRYLDHFQRRGSEWRILERTVVNDYSRAHLEGEISPTGSWERGGYPGGAYGEADPGVAFLARGGVAA